MRLHDADIALDFARVMAVVVVVPPARYAFTSTGAPFYLVVKACGYPCNLLCPCVWCAVCGFLPCGPQCVTCCGPCCGEPEGLATAIVWKNLMGFFFTSNIAGAGKPLAGGTAPNAEGMQR